MFRLAKGYPTGCSITVLQLVPNNKVDQQVIAAACCAGLWSRVVHRSPKRKSSLPDYFHGTPTSSHNRSALLLFRPSKRPPRIQPHMFKSSALHALSIPRFHHSQIPSSRKGSSQITPPWRKGARSLRSGRILAMCMAHSYGTCQRSPQVPEGPLGDCIDGKDHLEATFSNSSMQDNGSGNCDGVS